MVIDRLNYKEVLSDLFDRNAQLDSLTEVIFEVNGKSLHYRALDDVFFLTGLNCMNSQIFTELKIDAMKFCSELGISPLPGAFPEMRSNRDFLRVIYHLFICCEEYVIPPIELMDINISFD